MNFLKLTLVFCYLILTLVSNNTIAQSQMDIKAYLVINKASLDTLKKNGFAHAYIASQPDLYPIVDNFNVLDSADRLMIPSMQIMVYFLDANRQPYPTEAIGFKQATFSDSIHAKTKFKKTDTNDVLMIFLNQLDHKIKKATPIKLSLTFETHPNANLGFNIAQYPFAQSEAVKKGVSAFEPNDKDSRDAMAHALVNSTRNPMYLALPVITKHEEQTIPLRPEEGQNGVILEGNMSMPFTIVKGRDDQSRFFRLSGVFIEPEFTWRITNDTSSSPLLPLNTKVGFGVYKSFLLGNYRYNKKDTMEMLKFQNGVFKTFTVSLKAMHYSNGQDVSVYYQDTLNYPGEKRHDYKSGNFSTNYLQADFVYSSITKQLEQFSASISVRADGALPKAEFESDQEYRYGRARLLGMLMYKTPLTKRHFPFKYNKHHPLKGGSYDTPAITQHTFRLDFEYIGGNVSDYNPGGNERRMSARFRYINNPLSHRSMGYFVQAYAGRDYLNIRYNLWSFSAMLGLTFEFNRYLPRKEMIKTRLNEIYEGK